MNKVNILGVNVDIITMKQAVKNLEDYIQNARKPHFVATANAEMVMIAQTDFELLDILNSADLVVPDGAGVVWAASHQGVSISERVAGYDLTQNLLKEAANKGYTVFLFGGSPGIAEKAKKVAEQWYPGIRIIGFRDGYFSCGEESGIIHSIQNAKPDIILVALGVPKQEKWVNKHLRDLNVSVAIGVGGTFDVMAGAVKRAPLWMQQAKLEWLFRLLLQPSRFMRMVALPKFVFLVLFGRQTRKY